jgi:HK97 gp10 family phage protein
MNTTVKVEGLKELEDALTSYAPKLVKKSFKEAMEAACEPQVQAAKARAPLLKGPETKNRKRGDLRDSIGANVKVSKRGVRGRVGPRRTKGESNQSPGAWGLMVEFGSIHGPAQPYLRPAFDQSKNASVTAFAQVLKSSIPTIK